MKIVQEYPPNIEKIAEKLPVGKFSPVFTYGDTVYSPGGVDLSADLIAHESVHVGQQERSPEIWWDRYLNDKEFRLEQELEAYAQQYSFVCGVTKDRNTRHKFLFRIASELSSELYGSIIIHSKAMQDIRRVSGVKDKHYD